MYLSASALAVSTKGRYNKCSTFTFFLPLLAAAAAALTVVDVLQD